MPIDQVIAANIPYARKLKGVSQIELAQHLKISNATLYSFETGVKVIPDDTLFAIAKHLDQSQDWFLEKHAQKDVSTGPR